MAIRVSRKIDLPRVHLDETEFSLKSVSFQRALGKSSIARKPEVHP